MGTPLPDWYDDLEGCRAEAWAQLLRGAADRHHPFHTPAVATIDAEGAPSVRTVVLREASPARRCVRFHTDARSGKVRDLAADRRIALHAHHPGLRIQLRLLGLATLHRTTPLASDAWARTPPSSRADYRLALAPGTPSADPRRALEEAGEGEEAGRGAFVAVAVEVTRMEFLFLAAEGHRRARFDWPGGTLAATWLVP